MTVRYCTFETDAGWVGLLGSDHGLAIVTLPQKTEQLALRELGEEAAQARFDPEGFTETAHRLRDYFSGQRITFPEKLDMTAGTPFRRGVWEATAEIPWGETRSYGEIAARIGKPGAARAVGNALGKNPLPVIVPCHRVIAGDGSIGGFTGGTEMKRILLRLEGTTLTGRR